MRKRNQILGNSNIVGEKVTFARTNKKMKQKELLAKLQVNGMDITSPALSKLEGQLRSVTDIEIVILAKVLDVSVLWLLGLQEEED